LTSDSNTSRRGSRDGFKLTLVLAALCCTAALSYLAGLHQTNGAAAAPSPTYNLDLGGLHLVLSAGLLGLSVIFVLMMLLAAALLLALAAHRRKLRAVAATKELTESKALADERRKAELRYRALLEAAPDAIVIVGANGIIELANAQTEKLFGYVRTELLGQSVDGLVPKTFRERHDVHRHGFFQAPKVREMGKDLDLYGLRKDGTEFPVEISLSPLETETGFLVLAAIRDGTERRRSAELLKEKVEELKRSNDELQQFAYIASHDLQEPLRMVASYTQLLAKRYKGQLDSDADEFIAFAVDGCDRMKGMIRDLLEYSRAGTKGRPLHEIAGEEALNRALANLRSAIEESSAFVTHDSLPTITTDDTQLVQVFQNLVGNAIKYRGAAAPRIHVSAARNGSDEWVFSVGDNGQGIEPRYFERIFILFQRLHGRHQSSGTGIGLAICKKIVEQHGGRIWVESQLEKGSTFYFALPDKEAK